jgi:hypothetical protein
MVKQSMTRYCSDYKDVPGKPQCCGSCHDDAEAGYYAEMIELYNDPNDRERLTHRLCCRVAEWVDGDDLRSDPLGSHVDTSVKHAP